MPRRVGRPVTPGVFRTERGWRAFCRVDGILYSHRFPADATVQQMRDWRARMRIEHRGRGPRRAIAGTFGADLKRNLEIVQAMPSLADRRHHLEQWQAELGGPDRDRSTVTVAEVAATLTRWQM